MTDSEAKMAKSTKITRRYFLGQGAALASGGAAAAYFVPSRVFAAPGRVSANDRIGVAYIGPGRRASQLMGLPKPGQIVAVADVNLPRAEAVARAKKCRPYQDYHKMLESTDIDAVVVATPDHWHALASIHACQAGKHVYCEKPMTLTIAEGRAMVDAARRYERIVQVGSQQRSTPENNFACKLIRDGHIGKVHTVIGYNYESPWNCNLPAQTIPSGLDWDTWCGPTEVRPYHKDIYVPRASPGWISFRPYSGGEMTGWGAHGLDQVQCALGMDNSGPVEVWTAGGKFDPPTYDESESRKRGETLCGQPAVNYRYANGTVLKLRNGPHGGAVFIGDKGKITIDRGYFKIEPDDLAVELAPYDKSASPTTKHLQNWFDSIRSGELSAGDVEIGHRSTTVCHLGNIARWIGRPLRWDPEKEIFPDDAQANLLLQRDRREPYGLPNLA